MTRPAESVNIDEYTKLEEEVVQGIVANSSSDYHGQINLGQVAESPSNSTANSPENTVPAITEEHAYQRQHSQVDLEFAKKDILSGNVGADIPLLSPESARNAWYDIQQNFSDLIDDQVKARAGELIRGTKPKNTTSEPEKHPNPITKIKTDDPRYELLAKEGSCKGEDISLFFTNNRHAIKEAKEICSTCPVKEQCLQLAIDKDERQGVWGGYSAQGRKLLMKRASYR